MPGDKRSRAHPASTVALALAALFLFHLFLPLVGLPSPLGLAGGVQDQRDPTACEAIGYNWTSCGNAFASDDAYAYANDTGGVGVSDISTGSASANTLDITHVVASDEVLVVGVVLEVTDADKEVLSVVWDQGGPDQASLTRFTAFSPSHNKMRTEVWRITDPVAKTATVRITIEGGNVQKMGATCVSLTSVNTTTPLEGAVTQGGSGSSGSVSVTQEADDLAFVFAGHFQSADAFGIGGGETEHADFAAQGVLRKWAASEDGTGATTLSWTQATSNNRATLGFNINYFDGNDTAWLNFGYNLDPADTVNKVEVGVEWFRTSSEPILNVTVSWDGGSSWATNQTATNKSSDDDALEWLDFTSATAWDDSKLSDANFRVRVRTNASDARLDHVTVRVHFNNTAPAVSNFRLEKADVQDQRNPTACEAVGNNWTSCDNAFAGDDSYAYANASSGSPQFGRPNQYISSGGWTPTPLWQELDEVTADDSTTEILFQRNLTHGLVVYGQGSASAPRYREWSFGSEASAQNTASTIQWVVTVTSPTDAEEIIMGSLSSGNNRLYIQTWDGTSWTSNWDTSLGASISRRFDIAYEGSSGEAVAFFGDGTSQLKYRKRVAGTWDSSDQSCGSALSDFPYWVRAEPRPTNDDIFVGVVSNAQQLHALRWNGTANACGDQLQTSATPSVRDQESFDLAFEANSGDAFLVWGDASSNLKYAVYTTSWGGETNAYASMPDKALWVVADSDPQSSADEIAVGMVLNNGNFEFGAWNGTAWVSRPSAVGARDKTQRGIDVAFERDTGKAMFIFDQSANPAQLAWRNWTSSAGFGSVSVETGTTGDINFMQLRSDPDSNDTMAIYADVNSDLFHRRWNGSSWSSLDTALETSLSTATGREPFMFTWSVATDTFEVKFSSVSDPGTSAGHVVRYRMKKAGSADFNVTASLYEGATLRSSDAQQTLGATYATYSWTLGAAEADAITDYADLRLRIVSPGGGSTAYTTWAELEVPGLGKNDTAWKNFGFNLDPGDTVTKVEVGVEWFRSEPRAILNVTASWDGGSTWATNQTATNKTSDDDAVEWLDFTSATSWTASKLTDANFQARAGTNDSWARLDHIATRVRYNATEAGTQLDVDTRYYFIFNVTDDDTWADIGADGSVSLRLWYDGNQTPELTYSQQTTGGNYRIELKYVDTGDPSTASLSEWSLTGRATYNATASSLTAITNGYEFKLALRLGFQVKHAVDPTNATTGSYNDVDSWNAEVVADDGVATTTLQAASTGEHMEFGVFMYTFVNISADWTVTVPHGQAADTNTVTVYYRSNDDFRVTVWFTTHLVKGGDTIGVSNVTILAAADPGDNITADTAFDGLGESNAIYIFGSASWWFAHATDADENTVLVQFNVNVPGGSPLGTYVAQLTIKVVQRPA